MVPAVGVEPTRYCYHGILNPARLPIPPRRRMAYGEKNGVDDWTRTSTVSPTWPSTMRVYQFRHIHTALIHYSV